MANEFYTPSGTPADNSEGDPGVMRSEFDRIKQGFDKMPTLAGNANRPVLIDPSGSRMIAGSAVGAYEPAFPSTTTKIVFAMASAPPGYTQDTTNNDCMLRLVNTVGGGIGGTDSPVLMNVVPAHSHTQQGTFASGVEASSLVHAHGFGVQQAAAYGGVFNAQGAGTIQSVVFDGSIANTASGSPPPHFHYVTLSGVTTTNSGAANWAPKFYNAIIGVKD